MERTFKASWIQDTGLIAATLLNERGLKSTVERKVTCRIGDSSSKWKVPHWKLVNTTALSY
jgi:hypothetical protein